MSPAALDPTDLRLLALLRENARRNVSSLAEELGVSRASIYARVSRLEQMKVIAGYTVRMGADYGRNLVRAHVMIKLLPKLNQETEKALMAMSEVVALHSISGEHDMAALVEAADLEEIDRLIDRIGFLDGEGAHCGSHGGSQAA